MCSVFLPWQIFSSLRPIVYLLCRVFQKVLNYQLLILLRGGKLHMDYQLCRIYVILSFRVNSEIDNSDYSKQCRLPTCTQCVPILVVVTLFCFSSFFTQFRVLSSFAESAFYPHLRNPRFILICGIRLRNPLPQSASAFYPNPIIIVSLPLPLASRDHQPIRCV
jgi:hypothetical protein